MPALEAVFEGVCASRTLVVARLRTQSGAAEYDEAMTTAAAKFAATLSYRVTRRHQSKERAFDTA